VDPAVDHPHFFKVHLTSRAHAYQDQLVEHVHILEVVAARVHQLLRKKAAFVSIMARYMRLLLFAAPAM
jgi:hypothetical protein